jgi:hypothetical protein
MKYREGITVSMDSPQEFVKDIIDGDDLYFKGIDYTTLIGNFRVTEFLGIPQDVAKILMQPIVEPLLDIARENADNYVPKLKKLIDNPPKCIDDNVLYQGMQYFTRSEGDFAVNLIEGTFLKDYVKIPPGTREYMEKLRNIPLCNEA